MSWADVQCVCVGGLEYRDDCPACARIQHLEDLIERWAEAKKSYAPSKLTYTQMDATWIELCNAEAALRQEAEKL